MVTAFAGIAPTAAATRTSKDISKRFIDSSETYPLMKTWPEEFRSFLEFQQNLLGILAIPQDRYIVNDFITRNCGAHSGRTRRIR
jgi:hypothetical protein